MFAPAAADLLAGIALTDLGQPFDPERLVRLPPPVATLLADGARVETEVLVVDHFGNVQLAARPALLDEVAQVGTRLVMSAPSSGQAWPVLYGETFASVDPAELVLLADSGGYLAVAANGVSAAERTGLRPGTRVRIVVEKPPGGR
jgi:S-adenosylmethionine hydrolase